MRESWIVNLRMAFEGSAALAGQGSIVQGEPGSATPVSGIPMGIPSLLLPDRFIEAAAERGVQRLFLLCADSIEGPGPTASGTTSSSSPSQQVFGSCGVPGGNDSSLSQPIDQRPYNSTFRKRRSGWSSSCWRASTIPLRGGAGRRVRHWRCLMVTRPPGPSTQSRSVSLRLLSASITPRQESVCPATAFSTTWRPCRRST